MGGDFLDIWYIEHCPIHVFPIVAFLPVKRGLKTNQTMSTPVACFSTKMVSGWTKIVHLNKTLLLDVRRRRCLHQVGRSVLFTAKGKRITRWKALILKSDEILTKKSILKISHLIRQPPFNSPTGSVCD